MMSLEKKILKGASWLALFKLISQLFSWVITIVVARILVPSDYAIMEMATIITGYAAIFSQLGLGKAIIQKEHITSDELSSVFWFSFGFSVLLGLSSFLVAYPTANIFNEPRVIPITQSVSLLFLFTGLQIVPLNILKRDLEFKRVGFIAMTGVFVSAGSMYFIARAGGGVWTLIGGHLIREFTKLILTFFIIKWWPKFHFEYRELKSYLRFGLTVAAGGSLGYVINKSDKFFAGRAWQPKILGYYSFAMQLAQLPMEKIISLINQISFPAFSRLQSDFFKLQKLYLNTVKISTVIVLPLFAAGFFLGEDLIKVLLNEKWFPIIPVFKYLCLVQIVRSLNVFNGTIHLALGKPHRNLIYNLFSAVLMPLSFYLAVPYGLKAILIPWFTTYLVLSTFWIIFTLAKIRINIFRYLQNLATPFMATGIMALILFSLGRLSEEGLLLHINPFILLTGKILMAAVSYFVFIWFFDREFILSLKKLRAST